MRRFALCLFALSLSFLMVVPARAETIDEYGEEPSAMLVAITPLAWDGSDNEWGAIVGGSPNHSHWSADTEELPSASVGALVDLGFCLVPSGYSAAAETLEVSGDGTVGLGIGGTLTCTADASISGGGRLSSQVQGPASSGLLDVSGQLSIPAADVIEFNWLEGADASSMFGGTYTLATYGGSALSISGIPANTGGNISAAYVQNFYFAKDVNGDGSKWAVELELHPQTLGDADLDGDVDGDDLATFGLAWDPTGSGNAWSDGDFNFDGAISNEDLDALTNDWAPAGIAFSSTPAPEPGTACMLLLGACGLLICKRRRLA